MESIQGNWRCSRMSKAVKSVSGGQFSPPKRRLADGSRCQPKTDTLNEPFAEFIDRNGAHLRHPISTGPLSQPSFPSPSAAGTKNCPPNHDFTLENLSTNPRRQTFPIRMRLQLSHPSCLNQLYCPLTIPRGQKSSQTTFSLSHGAHTTSLSIRGVPKWAQWVIFRGKMSPKTKAFWRLTRWQEQRGENLHFNPLSNSLTSQFSRALFHCGR